MWTASDTWIIITASLCAVACALPGCFLVLRKMSMMGDAISHAVLPGLAVAFFVTGERASAPMFIGAIVTGILTALFTQWISKLGQVDRGASMGIVFTTLFAIGLICIVKVADHVDLDAGCVLYGAIEMISLDVVLFGEMEVPRATLIMAGIVCLNLLLVMVFFKELKLSAFDEAFCDTMGFSARKMHYLLMVMVAVTTVACFESLGSIIVIAMLVAPVATALLLTQRLVPLLIMSCFYGVLSGAGGHVLAVFLPQLLPIGELTTAGMIAVCCGICFVGGWSYYLLKQKMNQRAFVAEDL